MPGFLLVIHGVTADIISIVIIQVENLGIFWPYINLSLPFTVDLRNPGNSTTGLRSTHQYALWLFLIIQ